MPDFSSMPEVFLSTRESASAVSREMNWGTPKDRLTALCTEYEGKVGEHGPAQPFIPGGCLSPCLRSSYFSIWQPSTQPRNLANPAKLRTQRPLPKTKKSSWTPPSGSGGCKSVDFAYPTRRIQSVSNVFHGLGKPALRALPHRRSDPSDQVVSGYRHQRELIYRGPVAGATGPHNEFTFKRSLIRSHVPPASYSFMRNCDWFPST